jgi:hypothetical protein
LTSRTSKNNEHVVSRNLLVDLAQFLAVIRCQTPSQNHQEPLQYLNNNKNRIVKQEELTKMVRKNNLSDEAQRILHVVRIQCFFFNDDTLLDQALTYAREEERMRDAYA